MANAHELARGHKRLRALIEFASAKAGTSSARRAGTSSSPSRLRAIYTSSTASDHRAALNARAQIRRAEREPAWPKRGRRPWLR
jgi:hypothetical protein